MFTTLAVLTGLEASLDTAGGSCLPAWLTVAPSWIAAAGSAVDLTLLKGHCEECRAPPITRCPCLQGFGPLLAQLWQLFAGMADYCSQLKRLLQGLARLPAQQAAPSGANLTGSRVLPLPATPLGQVLQVNHMPCSI